MITTDVSDCYLTNAGVWTSHSSSAAVKDQIEDVENDEIFEVLDGLKPRKWKYRPDKVGNDSNRRRIGIVTQELPEEFSVPGNYPKGGLPDGVVGSFSLAALKARARREYGPQASFGKARSPFELKGTGRT